MGADFAANLLELVQLAFQLKSGLFFLVELLLQLRDVSGSSHLADIRRSRLYLRNGLHHIRVHDDSRLLFTRYCVILLLLVLLALFQLNLNGRVYVINVDWDLMVLFVFNHSRLLDTP